jgi:hypothetical protein
MSDTSTNPGEKPVNDGGGGTSPQSDSETTEEATAEAQVGEEVASD